MMNESSRVLRSAELRTMNGHCSRATLSSLWNRQHDYEDSFRIQSCSRLDANICHNGKQTMEDTVKLSSLIAYLVTFTYTLCRAHLCVNDLTLIVVTGGHTFILRQFTSPSAPSIGEKHVPN